MKSAGESPRVPRRGKIVLKKSRQLLEDPLPEKSPLAASLHTGSAAHTPGIESDSVALIVTSPPFLDIVQYKTDNWLRAWFAGSTSTRSTSGHFANSPIGPRR